MRGRPELRVGIKELPKIILAKSCNPEITIEELRNRFGNLRILNTPSNIDICMTRLNSPKATLQEIGDKFDLSRERVRQILKQMHLPTKAIRPSLYKFNCYNCGIESKRRFCSIKCRSEYFFESLYCEVCNVEIKRLKSEIKRNIVKHDYKHTFCSKRCQGIWLSSNYGFAFHKNNKIYDYQLIGELYLKGLKYKEISEIVGTGEKYLGSIINKLKKSGEIKPRINIKTKLIKDLLTQDLSCKEIFGVLNNTSLSNICRTKYRLQRQNKCLDLKKKLK